jgi:bleomycin hydrolase
MNDVLYDLLLSTANEIRAGKADGTKDARTIKHECLQDVYRILSIHLGSPPTKFDWDYRDRDGTLHSHGVTTPLEFLKQAIDVEKVPFETYVCLLHDPRHEYYLPYVWECSQTVVGGLDVVFLNVPIEEMKKINQNILEDGRPVFFACNVGDEFANKPGLWDLHLFETNKFYGIKVYGMSKKDRLLYGYPMGTHAMLMTGVDVGDDDAPRRWKVENSWGVEGGHDGYYTMNDNWYDDFVFEIVAPPQYLTDEMKKGLEKEPTVLPGWDSASARRRSHKR